MITINEKPLAIALIEYRNAHKLSENDVSEKVGISIATIKNIETGAPMSAKTICLLSEKLSDTFKCYIKPKTCPICGNTFIPERQNTKNCSKECSGVRRRNKQNEWYQNNNKKLTNGNVQKKKPPKIKLSQFEQLSRENKMTYGERQKLERLQLL